MSNEAAERLRDDAKDEAYTRQEWQALVDAALADERRATVERIRAALDTDSWYSKAPRSILNAILDAEAK